jgi:hypothetical protein
MYTASVLFPSPVDQVHHLHNPAGLDPSERDLDPQERTGKIQVIERAIIVQVPVKIAVAERKIDLFELTLPQ